MKRTGNSRFWLRILLIVAVIGVGIVGGWKLFTSITYRPPFAPIEFVLDSDGHITVQVNANFVTPLGDFQLGGNASPNAQAPDGGILFQIEHLIHGVLMQATYQINENTDEKIVNIDNGQVVITFTGQLKNIDGRGHHTILLTSPSASGNGQVISLPQGSSNSGALVPAGGLIYKTSAPGLCDSSGGNWQQNPSAVQSCSDGGLMLAGPDCPCPLGVVALVSIPGQTYPRDFVLQVKAAFRGSDSTAFFGFKFRQETPQDVAQGRGGYAFLITQNGHWEYNQYSSNGARNILSADELPFSVNASNTLDLVVNGSQFSFYVNGRLVSQQDDSAYGQGYLCLVAEPGAQVLFQDLEIYEPAG